MAGRSSNRQRRAAASRRLAAGFVAALMMGTGLASAADTRKITVTAPSFWQPTADFRTGVNVPGTGANQAEAASNFIQQTLLATESASAPTVSKLREFRDEHNGLYHVYMAQLKNGLRVENGGVKVTVDKNNKILTYTSTLAKGTESLSAQSLPGRPHLSAVEAVRSFAQSAGISLSSSDLHGTPGSEVVNDVPVQWTVSGGSIALGDSVKANLKYYQTSEAAVELVWSLEVETVSNWLNVFVSAQDGHIVAVADWNADTNVPLTYSSGADVQMGTFELEIPSPNGGFRFLSTEQLRDQATELNGSVDEESKNNLRRRLSNGVTGVKYKVLPIGFSDLGDGDLATLTDPQDLTYSHLGWHDSGKGPVSETKGNNVFAVDNPSGSSDVSRNKGAVATDYNFVFAFDPNADSTKYRDIGITNMFYVSNSIHDIYYAYGFTAEAGNFQNVNKGGVGKGNDGVVASCQDGSGTNNANFGTPPDGQAPRMRMYLWDTVKPYLRDGALSNDIVIHENTHGLSNRLTGGADRSNCLSSTQSGGMGEGWSDFYALALRTKTTDTRNTAFATGAYVYGKSIGIRKYPYTTDLKVNPHTYSYLKQYTEVHQIGEVWCAILNEVYWNLIDKLGFTPKYKDDAKSGKGNTVALQLVTDGLKLQPCNPTLVQARDAILQADDANNQGANKCEIWKGFAKRGLGVSAKSSSPFTDAFDVPSDCSSTSPTPAPKPTTSPTPSPPSPTPSSPSPTPPSPKPTTAPTPGPKPTTKPAPTPAPTSSPDCPYPQWLCCILYNDC